jgi:putative transposase
LIQHGVVLGILVQSRRTTKAAKRLLCEFLMKQRVFPRVTITDKLASCGAAEREIKPGFEHRKQRGLHSMAENSHQLTRRREQIIRRFKSAGQTQRFVLVHDEVPNLFRRPSNTHAAGRRAFRA